MFESCCLSAALLVFSGCQSSASQADAATRVSFDSSQAQQDKDGGDLGPKDAADVGCIATSSCAVVTGGNAGSAGTLASGGSVGSGGSVATGGNSGAAGTLATGGASLSSAGGLATGGTSSASAATIATGGSLGSGGVLATGGMVGSAGTRAGDAGAGGATGTGGSRNSSDANNDGASCSGWSTLVHLSPQQLKDLLAAQDVFLINVRSPNAPDIASTDLDLQTSTDVTPTVTAIEELVKHNTCAEIVIYCVSGNTSQRVATPLVDKGYLRVRDLQGGMNAWQAQGFPVTQ